MTASTPRQAATSAVPALCQRRRRRSVRRLRCARSSTRGSNGSAGPRTARAQEASAGTADGPAQAASGNGRRSGPGRGRGSRRPAGGGVASACGDVRVQLAEQVRQFAELSHFRPALLAVRQMPLIRLALRRRQRPQHVDS